ncbi:MAG: hypothetical protein ACE5EG_06005 [Thermoanaerobaculia bacterium]
MVPSYNSQRERRLWIGAGGLLLAIYASLYSVRPIHRRLRRSRGRLLR